jgi:putative ABC transport system permease protein
MLRHTILLSIRTLLKNKFHSILNILGLAIGISACLVIYLIVTFELSFNKEIPDNERIYRIHSKFSGAFSGLNRGAPTGVAPFVRDNFKGVENVTLFFCFGSKVEIPKEKETTKFSDAQKVVLASPDFFEVFKGFEWIAGTPEVLAKPNIVVLREDQAKKYFGTNDLAGLVGKEVIYRDSLSTTVAGIIKELPYRTDLEFTEFISIATIESSWLKKRNSYAKDDWASTNSGTQIFLKAQPGTTHAQLLEQLPLLTKMYAEKSSFDSKNDFNVQPLLDIHFDAETGIFDFSREVAHLQTLYILIGVGAILLIIAAINFINLATAQAVNRAKEVGVRKVLGSTRGRLIAQFLFEGLTLTLCAALLSIPLTKAGLTMFSEFVPPGVHLNVLDFVPFFLGVIFFIGIFASAYPAFVLSSFLPALALKNQMHIGSGQSRSSALRKGLIIFQFAVAQILIIGTLMVAWQIKFLLNKDLGFNKDAVIYFDTPWWDDSKKTKLLETELQSIPEIAEMSLSEAPPAYNGWSSTTIKYNNGKEDISINAFRKFGDSKYVKFYGMELLAGRNLQPSDSIKEFIINETLMKQFGIATPADAIGERLYYGDGNYPIVGVVKDFHIQSLHRVVEPVMMANAEQEFTCLNIRLSSVHQSGEQLQEGLGKIEKAWKKIYPDTPFKYEFLDETIKNFYKSERRTSKLTNTATVLAIFISCLGLFGLASFTTSQRTKEIGIRKVFGASVRQILMLLSKDFIVLVIIAFVFAVPVAWYLIENWLTGFSYRTEINYWLFGITAVVAIVIAFITVSYQTTTAANRNPVDTLRNE